MIPVCTSPTVWISTFLLLQIDNWYSPTPTGTYYLESDLYVLDGAKLSIDGGESEERECETLLLASNSSMIVNLRAYGGDLDIRDTKIFSWDLEEGDYDLLPETNGRRYIYIWYMTTYISCKRLCRC